MSQPPRPSLMKAQFIRADPVAGAGRRGRRRTAPHQHHDVGNAPLRVQRLGDTGRLLLPGPAYHGGLEVETRAEILACAPEHDDARVAVALKTLEIDVERIDQRRIERIETFRTIERHPVDAVV